MKTSSLLALAAVVLLSATAGWWIGRRTPPSAGSPAASLSERKILYYQSAMHPWITSDKPGKCTICGMTLTPVYEGEGGVAVEAGLVTLRPDALNVLHVQDAEVTRQDLRRTLRVAGVIEDDETRHRFVSAYAGGRVEDLYVNFAGAEFEAGQPLARFYSPTLLEAERQFLAVDSPGVLPADAEETRLLRDAAVRRLRQLGLTDAQIVDLPGKSPTNFFTEILAPVGGTVVKRFVYAGQYVAEGDRLLEIADLSTLWFLFDAYEQDLPWLHPGLEVEITTPSLPGQTLKAPIRFIDPTLVKGTRSAKVRVEIPNPLLNNAGTRHRRLRNQLYAEGRVVASVPGVLAVPRSAVLDTGDRTLVYLDRGGGAYEPRPVQLGRRGDDAWEVLEGLDPGDRVVIHGNLLIDAQAQLDQATRSAAAEAVPAPTDASHQHPAATTPPPEPDLTPDQLDAARALLVAEEALRRSLAQDDLAAFHRALPGLQPAREALERVFPAADPTRPLVDAVIRASNLEPAANLRLARQAFFPLSQSLVALFQHLRRVSPVLHSVKIYQCPMTAEAFDGAPPRARWIQPAPPLGNPWFGAEMLECGTEIQE